MTASVLPGLRSREGRFMLLKGSKVSGTLSGLIFEARVLQEFVNHSRNAAEVIYTFALPWGADLLGVQVQLGDKLCVGQVAAKASAQDKYESAIAEGHSAVLLEKNKDQSYTLNLGNLAPQETCTVHFQYAQVLEFGAGSTRLMIPTVIAPRSGAIDLGPIQILKEVSHDIEAHHRFSVELLVHGDLADAKIKSPTHVIEIKQLSDESGKVQEITLGQNAFLDRDFVLILDQIPVKSLAVSALDPCVEGVTSALASFKVELPPHEPRPVSLKLLVDCSGSMAGDSLKAAKRALLNIISQLGAEDRYSLSRFGRSVEHRSSGLWPVTPLTTQAANRWVRNLEADLGGTEMHKALSSTFGLRGDATSDVMIVTDGEVRDIEPILELARHSAHRVFVVGIGSSPATAHLKRLANSTAGACEFVAPGEQVEGAVLRMFSRLRSENLSDAKLIWPAQINPLCVSELQPAVFEGDTIHVFASLGQPLKGVVQLVAKRGDQPQMTLIAQVELPGAKSDSEAIARLGAANRFNSMRQSSLPAETERATHLAVQYQLVTELTHFLLIHRREESDRLTDMPDLVKIAHMMPAGWGGLGSVSDARGRGYVVNPDANARQDAVAYRMSGHFSLDTPDLPNPARWQPRQMDWASRNGSNADRMDPSELPDFLARPTDPTDPANPAHWSHVEHYKGLMPEGLILKVRANRQKLWPESYRELAEFGVGQAVIDWLEFIVSVDRDWVGNGGEKYVVNCFLHYLVGWGKGYDYSNEAGFKAFERLLGARFFACNEWPDSVLNLVVED